MQSCFTTIKNHNTLKHQNYQYYIIYCFTTIKNHNTLKPYQTYTMIRTEFYHYQESQHSQTAALPLTSVSAFYHYQESQHSQTSNCIFMQRFSASVSAYTRRRDA